MTPNRPVNSGSKTPETVHAIPTLWVVVGTLCVAVNTFALGLSRGNDAFDRYREQTVLIGNPKTDDCNAEITVDRLVAGIQGEDEYMAGLIRLTYLCLEWVDAVEGMEPPSKPACDEHPNTRCG